MARNLEQTLQALYDSEINVTLTTLWDGGYDFGLFSYMDEPYNDMRKEDWRHAKTAAELADALHEAAMKKFPTSGYAKAQPSTPPPPPHELG